MATAKVELVYKDKEPRELTVSFRKYKSYEANMNAIDRAVEKAAADDKDWRRWNLKDIDDG